MTEQFSEALLKIRHDARRRAWDGWAEKVLVPVPGFDWFRPMTPFIVVRGTGGRHDGMWFARGPVIDNGLPPPDGPGVVTARATGRYERRDDGMLAEIYEVGAPHESSTRRRSVLGVIR